MFAYDKIFNKLIVNTIVFKSLLEDKFNMKPIKYTLLLFVFSIIFAESNTIFTNNSEDLAIYRPPIVDEKSDENESPNDEDAPSEEVPSEESPDEEGDIEEFIPIEFKNEYTVRLGFGTTLPFGKNLKNQYSSGSNIKIEFDTPFGFDIGGKDFNISGTLNLMSCTANDGTDYYLLHPYGNYSLTNFGTKLS